MTECTDTEKEMVKGAKIGGKTLAKVGSNTTLRVYATPAKMLASGKHLVEVAQRYRGALDFFKPRTQQSPQVGEERWQESPGEGGDPEFIELELPDGEEATPENLLKRAKECYQDGIVEDLMQGGTKLQPLTPVPGCMYKVLPKLLVLVRSPTTGFSEEEVKSFMQHPRVRFSKANVNPDGDIQCLILQEGELEGQIKKLKKASKYWSVSMILPGASLSTYQQAAIRACGDTENTGSIKVRPIDDPSHVEAQNLEGERPKTTHLLSLPQKAQETTDEDMFGMFNEVSEKNHQSRPSSPIRGVRATGGTGGQLQRVVVPQDNQAGYEKFPTMKEARGRLSKAVGPDSSCVIFPPGIKMVFTIDGDTFFPLTPLEVDPNFKEEYNAHKTKGSDAAAPCRKHLLTFASKHDAATTWFSEHVDELGFEEGTGHDLSQIGTTGEKIRVAVVDAYCDIKAVLKKFRTVGQKEGLQDIPMDVHKKVMEKTYGMFVNGESTAGVNLEKGVDADLEAYAKKERGASDPSHRGRDSSPHRQNTGGGNPRKNNGNKSRGGGGTGGGGTPQAHSGGSKGLECWKCGQRGHMQKHCPGGNRNNSYDRYPSRRDFRDDRRDNHRVSDHDYRYDRYADRDRYDRDEGDRYDDDRYRGRRKRSRSRSAGSKDSRGNRDGRGGGGDGRGGGGKPRGGKDIPKR